MSKIVTQIEYRLNKKGCECFRSRIFKEVKDLWQQHGGYPKYTIQERSRRVGGYMRNDDEWGPWFDFPLNDERRH